MRRVSVSMGLLFSSRRGSTESIGSMAEGSGSTSMAGGGGGEASPRGGGRGSASVSVGGGVGGGGVRSRAASKASRRSGSKFTLRSVGSTASLQSQSSFESSARLDEASVETSCNGNGGNGGGSRRNTGGTTRSFGGAAQPDALVPVPVPVPGGGPPRPEPISESEIAISESLPNGTGRRCRASHFWAVGTPREPPREALAPAGTRRDVGNARAPWLECALLPPLFPPRRPAHAELCVPFGEPNVDRAALLHTRRQ